MVAYGCSIRLTDAHISNDNILRWRVAHETGDDMMRDKHGCNALVLNPSVIGRKGVVSDDTYPWALFSV